MDYLPCVEIEPAHPADAAVIWLHGLGADGHDFEPIVPELGLSQDLAVRFIFPHAPAIPVTVNGGYVMPAWYDIKAMDIDREVDAGQLLQSANRIRDLLKREVERGVSSQRIVLAGFSQGGAVAYQVALTHQGPLAGLLALSTYLATADSLSPLAPRDLPIAVYHGTADPIVPEILGQRSCERLREWGYAPQYRTYAMEHAVCMPELSDIGAFLNRVLTR